MKLSDFMLLTEKPSIKKAVDLLNAQTFEALIGE